MRGSKVISPAAAAFELTPSLEAQVLDLAAIFGRIAPLEVDLGCGDGSFITRLAAQSAERDFLGLEQLVGRVRSACKSVARQELTNVRIMRTDISHAVEHLLAPESVSAFYLLFPDPWPKRRHHRHRVVTERWLKLITRVLVDGGILQIATDHADYFEWMQRALFRTPALDACSPAEAESLPATTFENRFRIQGAEIHRLVLRKVSDPR